MFSDCCRTPVYLPGNVAARSLTSALIGRFAYLKCTRPRSEVREWTRPTNSLATVPQCQTRGMTLGSETEVSARGAYLSFPPVWSVGLHLKIAFPSSVVYVCDLCIGDMSQGKWSYSYMEYVHTIPALSLVHQHIIYSVFPIILCIDNASHSCYIPCLCTYVR